MYRTILHIRCRFRKRKQLMNVRQIRPV